MDVHGPPWTLAFASGYYPRTIPDEQTRDVSFTARRVADISVLLRSFPDAGGINSPNYVIPPSSPVSAATPTSLDSETFAQRFARWQRDFTPSLAASTRTKQTRMYESVVKDKWGTWPCANISQQAVMDWIAELEKEPRQLTGKPYSKTYLHKLVIGLQSILNFDARKAQTTSSLKFAVKQPLPIITFGVRNPKEFRAKRARCFSKEETKKIIAAAEGRNKVLFTLAGNCGARPSELYGLRIEDCDLQHGKLHLGLHTIWEGIQKEAGKTENADRWVPLYLFAGAVPVLLLKDYIGERESGLVFETENGTPLRNSNVFQDLKAILVDLSIPQGGMYAFRRHFCSRLSEVKNMTMAKVREYMGHGSDEMIRHYFRAEVREEPFDLSEHLGTSVVPENGIVVPGGVQKAA